MTGLITVYLNSVVLYFIILLLVFWKFVPCVGANGWVKKDDKHTQEALQKMIDGGLLFAARTAFIYCWVPVARFIFFMLFTITAFIPCKTIQERDD